MQRRPKKEQPKQQPVSGEVPYSDTDSNQSAVLEAERVAIGAFHRWVGSAGLSEVRVQAILNSGEGSPKSNLQGTREYSMVRRVADSAIKGKYEQLDDLDFLGSIAS